MKIIQKFSVNNDCYKKNLNKADSRYTTFQTRGPKGLMLHSVGTPQPDASVFANRWNRSGIEVAVHAVLQDDGTVYQCLPWNYRGWHAGGSANDTHIGVEMCEPNTIKYTSGGNFTILNYVDAKTQAIGCYKTAVDLFAQLCMAYHLDPMTDIISHAEGAKKGVASNHGDPEHLWRGLELSYTMDTFRKAVANKIKETENAMTEKEIREIVKDEIKTGVTRDFVLDLIKDQWIETFADLPNWAQPEMRELIKMGIVKGVKQGKTIEETVLRCTLNGYIRPVIITYRALMAVNVDVSKEAIREELKRVFTAAFEE